SALANHGYEIFWDRDLKVGMQWAEEIGRRIREADAIIPLISEAAVRSEMLASELKMAREAAAEQGGRPRILPVRVCYGGPLPPDLAVILDPIEYASWESPADTERLIRELLGGLDALQSG